MKQFPLALSLTLPLVALASLVLGVQHYRPSNENLDARAGFQSSKFGLFIHWGVYSVLGKGEWVMNDDKMTVADYEKIAGQFDPTEFDPVEWVALARDMGAAYITITAKDHDGFAMWGTKQSDWNVVDRTPYRRDPLRLLTDEAHKRGIKLFFYYSQLDWHHPDYFPLGISGQSSARASGGDWNRYLDYADNQLRELLTGYGEIGGIWLDGMWDKPSANWRLDRTYALIHSLQPAALIGNNHHMKPFEGEDFQIFEKDPPGPGVADLNSKSGLANLPFETADSVNGSWGYNASNNEVKGTADLIRSLVRAAGSDSNFLLNVGPTPSGKIPPEAAERLRAVGTWLRKYGDSIYGTRGGPVKPQPWGVTMQNGPRVYVHILDWAGDELTLPRIPNIQRATIFANGTPVPFQQVGTTTMLRLPASEHDPIDTIVVLKTDGN